MKRFDYKTEGKHILQMITNHAVLPYYTVEERIYNMQMFKAMVDTMLEHLQEELEKGTLLPQRGQQGLAD